MTIDSPRPEEISGLRRLWKQAFSDTDEFLDGFFSAGYSPSRCRCLHTEGQLAAALYWFDCTWQQKKVAYIYAVATDKAFRGKGLCRALMEDTHRHLKEQDYAGAALVPGSKELFSLYEKLGYRAFCPMDSLTETPGSLPLPVDTISPQVYGALRKTHLPEDGICQDGETLDFFATYGAFYRTEHTIFCAAREDKVLYFQEYLGDPAHVPGILAALGAEKGVLRLPGENTPFAMYLPLDHTDKLPSYLGIALD